MNLIRLFERMQNYQYEQNSDPDKILDLNVRTLTEDDIDRLVSVCLHSLLEIDFNTVSSFRFFNFCFLVIFGNVSIKAGIISGMCHKKP